jgi:hypothetical protein
MAACVMPASRRVTNYIDEYSADRRASAAVGCVAIEIDLFAAGFGTGMRQVPVATIFCKQIDGAGRWR